MEPKEQLQEVSRVLETISRFRHINGWAAIAAGVLSLVAYSYISIQFHVPVFWDGNSGATLVPRAELIQYLLIMGALLVAATAIGGGIILFTIPKDMNQAAWRNFIKLIILFGLYIGAGMLVLYAVLNQSSLITIDLLRAVPPMMCIFYALALMHASQTSVGTLKYLGAGMFLCGAIGVFVPALGWPAWAVGFGIMHIISGIYLLKAGEN